MFLIIILSPQNLPSGSHLPNKIGGIKDFINEIIFLFSALRRFNLRPGLLTGSLIIAALLAFEAFNYSTTDYALRDLLGNLRFAGVPWSTILAVAFCGIDFAGIARLFTPQQGADEPKEVWYLFGAWLLAATMNAGLTWWGISMAIINHAMSSTAVVDSSTLTNVVPVFVALMVWVIRILVIGTLSSAGEKIFTEAVRPAAGMRQSVERPARTVQTNASVPGFASNATAPRPLSARPEPTYQGLQARSSATPRPAVRNANRDNDGQGSYRL